jgi:sodium/hydrogen antiporter
MPETPILVLTGIGFLIGLVAWMPLLLKQLPLSLPIVCLAIGAGLFALPGINLEPMPFDYPEIAERLTECVVIIALMGAGLKLDRRVGWRRWTITWRLLAFTMPLSIAAIVALGVYGLGLSLVAAILLGASLAPTDPVLASDVQVGPPRTGAEDDVRFGLTSEAGLNDGFAFPFVNLAIGLAAASALGQDWVLQWALYDVLWKIGAGVLCGWLLGKAFGWLIFHMPGQSKMAKTGDGLVALAATFISYGLTEMVHGYGFLAVFVVALTIRSAHRQHEFNDDMHNLVEQVERLAMMVVLLLFGGALATGLIAPLGMADYLVAAVIILIVRPLTGLIAMVGFKASFGEKLTIAFFGIRGIGSFYYLAYGLNHIEMEGAERLWGIVGLICLMSIVLHGLTVTPLMRKLDRKTARKSTTRLQESP